MLNCEYCDYFVNAGGECCKFSGHVFIAGEMESETEYPCRDISYQEYLNRKEAHVIKFASERTRRVLHVKKGRISAGRRLPAAG